MATTVSQQFVITLDDGQAAVIADGDEAKKILRSRVAKGAQVRTRVSLRDPGDTEGHAASNVVAITLSLDDDTEGHALSLRFPSAEAARNFEKRMLATGLLVGTVAATAVGIGVGVGIQSIGSQAAPVPITAPATRDMDKNLTTPITAPATRDMDKNLTIPTATRDMDKNLTAPITAPATRDMDKNLTAPITAPATRDMDKNLTTPTATRDMDKDLSTPAATKAAPNQRMTPQ